MNYSHQPATSILRHDADAVKRLANTSKASQQGNDTASHSKSTYAEFRPARVTHVPFFSPMTRLNGTTLLILKLFKRLPPRILVMPLYYAFHTAIQMRLITSTRSIKAPAFLSCINIISHISLHNLRPLILKNDAELDCQAPRIYRRFHHEAA